MHSLAAASGWNAVPGIAAIPLEERRCAPEWICANIMRAAGQGELKSNVHNSIYDTCKMHNMLNALLSKEEDDDDDDDEECH